MKAVSEGVKVADGRYVCELATTLIMWMRSGTNSLPAPRDTLRA